MFTRNTKYLAHVISKGVKGDFAPVLDFLNKVTTNLPTLLSHLDNEETKQYLTTFLQVFISLSYPYNTKISLYIIKTIKPALVAKSPEVSLQALILYENLCQSLSSKNLLSPAWDWLLGFNGLYTCLLGLRRHPELLQPAVSFLIAIGSEHLLELFTDILRTTLDDDKQYLFDISKFLGPLLDSLGAESFKSTGILEDWLQKALEIQSKESTPFPEVTMAALGFITEAWLLFPEIFEGDETQVTSVITSYKKACKYSKMSAFSSIVSLFRLLEQFARQKHPYAPLVYKTLTFILIENCQNIEIRGLIMMNLKEILGGLDSIPLSIVIEPWVKQIQVSGNEESVAGYVWNVVDYEFMRFLANQEKLSIKNAIQILDLLSKTFLNDHIYASIALEVMVILINRFLKMELMGEFISKLIKISLAIYFAGEKKLKSRKAREKVKVSKPNPAFDELNDSDLNTIAAQKNAMIVKFLKTLAEIKEETLTEKLKPLVAHTNLQLKKQLNMKTNDKGMLDILSLWGNPDKLSSKYETEYYENIAKEKLMRREEEIKKGELDTTRNISMISATSVREIENPNLTNVMSASFDQKSPENTVMAQDVSKGGDLASNF